MAEKVEFVRNRALEENIDFYAKRITTRLIAALSDGGHIGAMVLAFEQFAPIIRDELDHLLTGIECHADLYSEKDG